MKERRETVRIDAISSSVKNKGHDTAKVQSMRPVIDKLPLIRVKKNLGRYQVVDGRHRLRAHIENGEEYIEVIVLYHD